MSRVVGTSGILRIMSLLLLACVLVLWPPLRLAAEGPKPHQAALIVEYGDGRVDTRCVSFSEEKITGVDLLSRSGLAVGFGQGAIGIQVCKVGDTGCDVTSQPCFCQCLTADCHYWTYFTWRDGAWVYSQVGAGQRQLADGDADAWVWGNGKQGPSLSPEGICSGQVAEQAASATATVAEPTPVAEAATVTATAAPETSPEATARAHHDIWPTLTALPATEAATASAATAPLLPSATLAATATAEPTRLTAANTATLPPPLNATATGVATPAVAPASGQAGRLGSYLRWGALVVVAAAVVALALVRRRQA